MTVDEARGYVPAETTLTDEQIEELILLAQETVESITGQRFLPVEEARVLDGSGRAVQDVREPILSVSQIRFRCGPDWEVQEFNDVRIMRSGMMISLGNVIHPGAYSYARGIPIVRSNNVTLTYPGACGFPVGVQNVEITGEWGVYRTVPRPIKAAVGLLVKYATECDDPKGVPVTPYESEGVATDRTYQYRKIFEGAKVHGETGFADVDSILARYMRQPSATVV
jgi:hypothetical protein